MISRNKTDIPTRSPDYVPTPHDRLAPFFASWDVGIIAKPRSLCASKRNFLVHYLFGVDCGTDRTGFGGVIIELLQFPLCGVWLTSVGVR
ncbi:MAG: hypothetical protein J6V72_01025, partial [Kiritimatiellae bacterium]|nr:hypothetical protein [Kiritimatiellia bacterium]